MVRAKLPDDVKVARLHLGGGTPTLLPVPLLKKLMNAISANFVLLAEALPTVTPAMKIYPRVTGWSAGRINDYQIHHEQLARWLTEHAT